MNEGIATTSTAQEKKAQRKTIRWGTILVWLTVAAVLALLGWGLKNSSEERPAVGAVAPTFNVQFYDDYKWQGQPQVNLEDLRGKVVVLNFWASWCVECRLEAGLLEDAWRQYGDQGVVFLGVAYVDSQPKSLAYLKEFDITYPNGPDLRSVISDEYEITGVPETFFIDKEGTISRVVVGPVNATVLHSEINRLMAQ
jgi:cytochrome c biogenesis protein CcmG/thiol:disulfide interchange protein DsbE